MDAAGSVDAAVLVPIYGWPADPGLIFTERRHDLRRHAGEISFPGGRSEDGEGYVETALREAEEEIGLERGRVDVVGALPRSGPSSRTTRSTLIVGLIETDLDFDPNPAEVETVLAFDLAEPGKGFAMRRLVRRGSRSAPLPTWLPST